MRCLKTICAGGAVLLVLVTACGVDTSRRSPTDDGQTSRTGSGVSAPAVGDTPVVMTTDITDTTTLLVVHRELVIGDQDGSPEYSFGDVTAAVPTPDGGVITWDAIQRQVRRYDAQGTHVRTIGRYGPGPGEYGDLFGMALLPDHGLAVWDAQHTRVELYDSVGSYRDSWHATSDLLARNGLKLDNNGNLLLLIHVEPPAVGRGPEVVGRREGFERREVLSGRVLDTIFAPLPLPMDDQLRVTQSGGNASVRVPFVPQLSWAITRSGTMASGDGREYVIHLAATGTPSRRIERALHPIELAADERKNHEERLYSIIRRMDPSYPRRLINVPDTKPYFRSIAADASGRIFVHRYMEASRIGTDVNHGVQPDGIPPIRWREPTVYDVFTENGCYLGSIQLPDRSLLLAPAGSNVWYVTYDSLDVARLVKGSFRTERSCLKG